MNKEQIEKRISEINMQMEVMKAQYAKLEGHLYESQHWLDSLVKFEAEKDNLCQEIKEDQNAQVNNEAEEQTA